MKRWIGFAVLSSAIFLGAADQPVNLVTNGDAETGTLVNWTGFTKVSTDSPHSGKYCFSVKGSAVVESNECIPVDPDKTYTLTAWLKSTGKEPSLAYVGYVPCDADKTQIEHHMVDACAGSETTLFAACSPADKIIKIADGSKWIVNPSAGVFFGVDDSGKYADLPNRKFSSFNILRVEKKGTYWEVQLQDACGQSSPAGTKVREHIAGGTFIYNAGAGIAVPMEWTKFTATIHGRALYGAPDDQWWHGTKYAKILLLLNFGQNQTVSVAADDISMTASDK